MQKNDCTIQGLEQKIKGKMEEEGRLFLYMYELDEENIFYTIVQEENKVYYLCKDGLCGQMLYIPTHQPQKAYIRRNTYLFKIEENDLDEIAKNYHMYKRRMEKIQQDVEAMEKVLDSQKIRGLFAKLKAGK